MGLKLVGEVSLDGSGFERGVEKLAHAAKHNLKDLVAGAFGVYSVHQVIHRTIESAEELVTTSKRLDVAVERLQVLRQAAKENNVEFARLATAFDKLNVAREKALGGGQEGAKVMLAFNRMGVTPEMLRTMSAANIFMGPMHQRASTTSVQDLDLPMRRIFEKGFGELIPVLKTDFDELGEKMQHLGSIMSTDTAVAVKQLADEFDLLANIIVAQTAPALVEFAKGLIIAAGKLGGLGSFFGSGSFRMRDDQVRSAGLAAFLNPIYGAHKFLQLIRQFDPNEASAAYAAQQEAWDKMLKEMQDKIAASAEALKNPAAPEQDTEAAAAHKRASALKAGDSLVSVGNFLGHTGNSLQRMNERKINLLTQIANNTKPKSNAPTFPLFPIFFP